MQAVATHILNRRGIFTELEINEVYKYTCTNQGLYRFIWSKIQDFFQKTIISFSRLKVIK